MTTIKQELTRRLLWTLLPLLAVGGVGVYVSARTSLLAQFDATLRATATTLAVATQQDEGQIVLEIPAALRRQFKEESETTVFQMWDRSGTPIARSPSLGSSNLPRFGRLSERPAIQDVGLPSGVGGRAISLAFEPRMPEERDERQAATVGLVNLVVASDRRGLDRTLGTLAAAIAGAGAVLAIVTLVLVPRVLARGLAPLDGLADQAARIDANSLATRFPESSLPGELKPIAERLNALLARLEDSFERERQFGADLAHELRTPVAELRSAAELALRWPEARETQTDRDNLAIAIHMEGLVDRLLALLRSERGLMQVVPEPVSLSDLLRNVTRSFTERAEAKGLHVCLNLPEGGAIESDTVILRSIMTNLIENAVDYTSAGRRVDITAIVLPDGFSVRVTNPVDQFDEADLGRLFERFWRHDSARADAAHNGLGLPLARAFAIALGLTLTAGLDGDKKLTLCLAGPTRHSEFLQAVGV